MKLGIIGLPQSGKSTVFSALTRMPDDPGQRSEDRIGTIRVPDERVDRLSGIYQPKKTTFAQIEYVLPGSSHRRGDGNDPQTFTPYRDCDALIHVVRNVTAYGLPQADANGDFAQLNQDLILTDQIAVEKRLERLEQEVRRGRKINLEEQSLLKECLTILEAETPLRRHPNLASAPVLRGFAFLSAKPMLVLVNNDDDAEDLPSLSSELDSEAVMVIRAKLEQEISQMTDEETIEFLEEFNLTAPATDRVILRSYELMGLISFFTVGDDEVKAWTIQKDTPAVSAAGVIHSDIEKGFIRAEVVAYDAYIAAGTMAEARKQAQVRLEGKTYAVQDGDIINYRFNV